MTLTEFLLARIAEDEAVARKALEHNAPTLPDSWELSEGWDDVVEYTGWVEAHPARVLAECGAKRQIAEQARKVAWIEEQGHVTDYSTGERDAILSVLRILALPYADHPDFREEWKA